MRFQFVFFIIIFSGILISSQLYDWESIITPQNKNVSEKSTIQQQEKKKMDKVVKSEDEWKKMLTDLEYQVTREKGTERPFTGELYYNTDKGIYTCKCCGAELFKSDEKYDAGCGWPSFWDAIDKSKITEKKDYSFGMIRIEVMCARCDAHLGHVFDDGPKPSGIRYCINSVSLNFKKESK